MYIYRLELQFVPRLVEIFTGSPLELVDRF
jgi:hypothetical protein